VRLAGRQHAMVTVEQLAAAGIGRAAIAHRVAKGWLVRVHRGVYLLGPLRTPYSELMAAVLAYGRGTVLSHQSAAVLWRLRPPAPGPSHVIVTGPGAHSREAIRVHRTRLHPDDASRRHGIPVTSPARTLLDLATAVPQRDLDRAVNEARVLRLVTDRSLNEQLSRHPRRRGTAALKEALPTDPKLTRSEAEKRLLELIRKARLPEPETNARINGYEVDFLWRAHALVVEVDGYAFHSSRRSFEQDRRRDRALLACGLRVMRLTWHDIIDERDALIAELAAAIIRRAS
jgi:very-short-patch-repair endonuclease